MTVSHTLPRVLGSYQPTPREKKKQTNRGYDVTRNRNMAVLLSDSQVLEARWLHEFGGWSTSMVRDHYELSAYYVYSLLNYATRSKLFPKKDMYPVGYHPKGGKVEQGDSGHRPPGEDGHG